MCDSPPRRRALQLLILLLIACAGCGKSNARAWTTASESNPAAVRFCREFGAELERVSALPDEQSVDGLADAIAHLIDIEFEFPPEVRELIPLLVYPRMADYKDDGEGYGTAIERLAWASAALVDYGTRVCGWPQEWTQSRHRGRNALGRDTRLTRFARSAALLTHSDGVGHSWSYTGRLPQQAAVRFEVAGPCRSELPLRAGRSA
jgi:hypothetical protein